MAHRPRAFLPGGSLNSQGGGSAEQCNRGGQIVGPGNSDDSKIIPFIVALGYPLSGMLATDANLSVGNVSALAGLRPSAARLSTCLLLNARELAGQLGRRGCIAIKKTMTKAN